MHYAVYRQSDGVLVSIATVLGDGIPNGEYGAVPYETAPDLATVAWDAAQRMFVPRVVAPRGVLSRQTFMDRLGDACVIAVQLASVPAAGDTPAQAQMRAGLRAWLLRFQIVSEVDVLDPRTIAGVDALIAAGLLASERRATVLALPGA